MVTNTKILRVPGGRVWLFFLLTIAGYTILNRGFAYIGYYPIFIGEVALLFYLIKLRHANRIPAFLRTTAGKSTLLLFYYCLIMFVIAAFKNTGEALRNSVFWVYILNFYIGWRFGRAVCHRGEQVYLERFLIACGIATTFYYSLFPFRDYLLATTLYTNQGGGVAFIGYYSTLHALAISIVIFPIYLRQRKLFAMITSVGLSLIIFVSQSRGAMLAFGTIVIYLCINERRRIFYRNILWVLFFGITGALLFSILDISIEGTRGQIGFQTALEAASSILFGSDLDIWSGSRTDRLVWWADILQKTMTSFRTAIFGLGLDHVLVNRKIGPDIILRYPHNSYLTVLGHTGIIGLLLYLNAVATVCLMIFRKATKGATSSIVRWYPIFAIGWLVSAFFSTVFEAPFHSFVFWSVSGITYYIAENDYQTRNHNLYWMRS